jgi:hypothetical protein
MRVAASNARENQHYFFWVLLMLLLSPSLTWGSLVRVYVTNSAGDSVHVIDPATNKVAIRLVLTPAHISATIGV